MKPLQAGRRRRRLLGWGLLLALALLSRPSVFAQDAPETGPTVVVCPISEMVDQGLLVVVQRAVEEAQDADALILEVDTPGGLLDTAGDIVDELLNAGVPTLAYVKGMGGISAGALISIACDEIVMSPEATIGALVPVTMGSQGMQPVGEKVVSFVRTKATAIAELKSYNPAIVRAMVDQDIELYAQYNEDGTVQVWSPLGNAGGAADQNGSGSSESATAIEDALRRVAESTEEPIEKLRKLFEDSQDEKPAPVPVPVQGAGPIPQDGKPHLILAKGKVLTLTAGDAAFYGFSSGTYDTLDGVLEHMDLAGASVRRIKPTWQEEAYRWLTNPTISGILILLALGGLYFELQTPGIGFPLAVSIIAFTLFFGARAILGFTEWIDIALVIIGIVLLIIELFVTPGFGLAGIAGIICGAVGMVLSFTLDGFSIPEYPWEFQRLQDAAIALGISLSGFIVLVWATWKFLPHTSVFRYIVLADDQSLSAGYVVQTEAQEQAGIGMKGVATTMLRPAGRGRFEGKLYDIVSRGEFITKDTPLVVVAVEGNRYVVDPIGEEDKA